MNDVPKMNAFLEAVSPLSLQAQDQLNRQHAMLEENQRSAARTISPADTAQQHQRPRICYGFVAMAMQRHACGTPTPEQRAENEIIRKRQYEAQCRMLAEAQAHKPR